MKLVEVLTDIRIPKPFKYGKEIDCANPNLLIGLELETENCRRIGREVSTGDIERLGFQTATDGSLRGTAFEFISRPMAMKHALASLTDFFELTKFDERNYSDRCSTHVHVNCTDLTLEQISNVALVYQVVEEILFEFVGHNRESNIYCIPWNQCRNHHRLVSNFLAEPRHTLKGWNKYTALNLLPLMILGTVEFRQLDGTSDMKRLTTWINLIGSIFKYATKMELNNLTQVVKELNTTSHYEHFFTEVLGGYLPYNELYRAKLEEGVILAKFGLVSTKSKPSRSIHTVYDELYAAIPTPARLNIIAGPDVVAYNTTDATLSMWHTERNAEREVMTEARPPLGRRPGLQAQLRTQRIANLGPEVQRRANIATEQRADRTEIDALLAQLEATNATERAF